MADRYWVGGSGNWSDDTNHWAITSGGAPGAGNLPTASDNAIFNSASNATAYTVTFNTAVAKVCNDLNFSAAPLTSGTITWAGTQSVTISGNLTCLTGMTRTYTGAITFDSTAAGKTVTMNGVTLASAITFSGAGGAWTLQDNFTTTNTVTLSNGTFDTNGKVVQSSRFTSIAGTRVLTLGNTTWTLTGNPSWNVNNDAGFTLNANTSTLTIAGSFTGGSRTYNNVTGNTSSSTIAISDANTFANLTLTAPATTQIKSYTIDSNTVVTGTLTAPGGTASKRVRLASSSLGTARTVTAAAVSLADIDFRDITAAGVASPFTGTRLGNGLGNSNITFVGGANRFWVGNTGNAQDVQWATTSGGAPAANNFPLPQDSMVFDAASFSADGQSISFPLFFNAVTNIDFSLIDQNITFSSPDSAGIEILGNVVLRAGMTWGAVGTLSLNFSGRGAQSLTTAGVSAATSNTNITSQGVGNTLTLNDALTSSGSLSLFSGTIDLNDKAVQVNFVGIQDGTTVLAKVMQLRSSTITLPGTNSVWSASGSTTVVPGTSTIKITDASATTKTFGGGGFTYNNIWLTGAGTGTFNFAGSNTFNDFKVDTPPHTILFTAGTTTTVTTFTVTGTAGNLMTIGSITAASHALAKAGGGTISCDYMSISRSDASPAATWYAGPLTHSTDGGNNTGWVFTNPPGVGGPPVSRGMAIGMGIGLGVGR